MGVRTIPTFIFIRGSRKRTAEEIPITATDPIRIFRVFSILVSDTDGDLTIAHFSKIRGMGVFWCGNSATLKVIPTRCGVSGTSIFAGMEVTLSFFRLSLRDFTIAIAGR